MKTSVTFGSSPSPLQLLWRDLCRALNEHDRQVSLMSAKRSRDVRYPIHPLHPDVNWFPHEKHPTPHTLPTAPSPFLSHDRKRYVDGLRYCTKASWFAKHPNDFPAPFHKPFHLEMGVEAAGGTGVGDSSDVEKGNSELSSAVRPEMLVDYVRIAQVR